MSSETWGRLWDFMTPRSARRRATVFEAMEEPRSAWMVSWPARMACFSWSPDQPLGERALSLVATIHPTTYRLKMSRIT